MANNIGLLMWSTDKGHKERLAEQLSTMDQRPHERGLQFPTKQDAREGPQIQRGRLST
jgi:hypothetical protein